MEKMRIITDGRTVKSNKITQIIKHGLVLRRTWLIVCVILLPLIIVSCLPGESLPDSLYTGNIYPGSALRQIGSADYPFNDAHIGYLYTWNGTAWSSNMTGPPGAAGATGATGATGAPGATGSTGAAGPNSVNSTTTSTNITGLLKGDGSVIQVAVVNTDYQSPLIQGCKAYNNADVAITKNSWNLLSFNSEYWDTDSIHDIVTNNSRLICKTAGYYLIHLQICFAQYGTAGTYRMITIGHSSGVTIALKSYLPSLLQDDWDEISVIYYLNFNEYVTASLYQTTAGNLNSRYLASYCPVFMMYRMGQ